jgi:hypothetical protein
MTEQQDVAQPPYPREPNVHSGGKQEPGGLTPPYEGRSTSGEGTDSSKEEPLAAEKPVQASPREVSQAEREGISSTDPRPAGPHGVGQSTSTSGNEPATGMSEAARKSERMDTGVSREPNVDPESPQMHTGDQGS